MEKDLKIKQNFRTRDHELNLRVYQNIINTLTEFGQEKIVSGRIEDCYKKLFNDQGCEIKEYNFGILMTIIIRISPVKKT